MFSVSSTNFFVGFRFPIEFLKRPSPLNVTSQRRPGTRPPITIIPKTRRGFLFSARPLPSSDTSRPWPGREERWTRVVCYLPAQVSRAMRMCVAVAALYARVWRVDSPRAPSIRSGVARGAAVASTTVTLVKRGSTRGARLYSRLAAAAAAALPSRRPLSPAAAAAGTGRGRVRGRFLGPTTGAARGEMRGWEGGGGETSSATVVSGGRGETRRRQSETAVRARLRSAAPARLGETLFRTRVPVRRCSLTPGLRHRSEK